MLLLALPESPLKRIQGHLESRPFLGGQALALCSFLARVVVAC